MAVRAGHILTVADFDVFGVTAYKTGDESVTSSTTLQNDDQLLLPVVASSRYILDCLFGFTGAGDPGGGLKLAWTGPASSTLKWATYGANQGALTSYDVVVQALAGGRVLGTNGATEMSAAPRGLLTTAGTGGTLTLQWAQGTSNATATVLKSGSFIRLTKIS